jgi:hypothetical protein
LWKPSQHQLLVSLGADRFSLLVRTGLTKSIILQHHSIFAPNPESSWKVALNQLDQYVQTLKLPANTQLSITLASDLVRYIVLPAQDVVMSASEKYGYAQAAYREIYGGVAENWRISLDDAQTKEPAIACAIDRLFYESVEQMTQKHQLKIKKIEPYLMTAFNRLFHHVRQENATLAIIEPTRMIVATLQSGVCQQIRCEKYSSDWQTVLNQVLLREALLAENASKVLMVYAPANKDATLNLSQHWSLKRLGVVAKQAINQPNYAMLEALA